MHIFFSDSEAAHRALSEGTEIGKSRCGTPGVKRYEVSVSRDEIVRRLAVSANTSAAHADLESAIFLHDEGTSIVLSRVGPGLGQCGQTVRLRLAPHADGGTTVDVGVLRTESQDSPLLVLLITAAFMSFLAVGPFVLLPFVLLSLELDRQRQEILRQRSLERVVFQTLAPLESPRRFGYRCPAAGPSGLSSPSQTPV